MGRTLLATALAGCAAALGAASDDTDGASRPPWRVYKVAPLTWSVSTKTESQLPDGTECRTPASLTGHSNPFYVGTPATKRITSFGVRTAKTRASLAYGKRSEWRFTVPARMTLTVGETTCTGGANGGLCAGTYHSIGGVIGYVQWLPTEDPKAGPSGLVWSHKIAVADHRPPMSCGPDVGEPVYELFFGGRYNPGGGGTFQALKGVPLQRTKLVAGGRFTRSTTGIGDVTVQHTSATFTPVR
jgi:hypothetical protein